MDAPKAEDKQPNGSRVPYGGRVENYLERYKNTPHCQ